MCIDLVSDLLGGKSQMNAQSLAVEEHAIEEVVTIRGRLHMAVFIKIYSHEFGLFMRTFFMGEDH
jgi:hypothetical protein